VNSKNFNAAEKHFEKKRIQIQKQLDAYIALNADLRHEKSVLEGQVRTLQADLEQHKEWIERLLTYTELNIEDIKKACEKDKQVADTFKALNSLSGYFGGVLR
jgi:ABC-type phosphate transport system auxiliary subunit